MLFTILGLANVGLLINVSDLYQSAGDLVFGMTFCRSQLTWKIHIFLQNRVLRSRIKSEGMTVLRTAEATHDVIEYLQREEGVSDLGWKEILSRRESSLFSEISRAERNSVIQCPCRHCS